MVDAFVSFAVQKLGDFLVQEVALRRSLRESVSWLRNELLFMQSFLKDAEEKQAQDQRVQQWVFEINSVANEAVAILETYNYIEAIEGGENNGFIDHLKACACICRKETRFNSLGKEIESLKQRIIDISRKRETYGIRDINIDVGEGSSNYRPVNNHSSVIRTLRRATTSYTDEDYIFVGFQDVVERLLDELLKREPRRCVLSIYGMGGLGKTSLARHLYNSSRLITNFPTRAWICVSQEYSISDLLRSIIRSIQGYNNKIVKMVESFSERELEDYLRDLLKDCKYLVVVDDVWHREAWESLKRAFPDSKNGSRVIVTTRKEDVAERLDDKSFAHKLRFLNQEESWDLFCKKLTHHESRLVGVMGQWSPIMEGLAKEMVEKCRGLPLAIVVLGGLLSYKKGLQEWKKVKAHIWRHMKNDSIEISHILSLSYNDLSTELKLCFLYFGIFPEDHVINTEKLMWLWMAEGFIPVGEAERTEDTAEDFLSELIRRSLVQVAKTFWGKVSRCRIHDLLRELAVQKAMEVNFFDIYDPRKHLFAPLRHRHAIHTQGKRYLSLDFSNIKLRSLLYFDKETYDHELNSKRFCNMFKHLYVLNFENIHSSGALPDAIGTLVHLKFLGLEGCNIELAPSIGKLKSLQTLLWIPHNRSCILPLQISNLVNLRHLVTRYEKPLPLRKLTSLQTLRSIHCEQLKVTDAVGLVNLHELVMERITKSCSLNNICSLKSLSTLFLGCKSGETFPPLEPLSSCQNLYKLWLNGKIEKLPLPDQWPKSITMMVFRYSRLMEDPMPILGTLPNLRSLDLVSAYEGKEITCNDNSFGPLELLHLADIWNVERWHLATSSMPQIKGLGIYDCSKLIEIPERMKHVAILERPNRTDSKCPYLAF